MSDHPTHSDPIDAEYEPADTTEETTPESKPVKSGGPGWISLTFVALIALCAAGLSVWSSGLLQQTGLLPSDTASNTDLDDLRSQQAVQQTRIGELASQVEGLIDRIDGEIARIETEIAELPAPVEPVATPTGETAALPEKLATRLASLEEQMTALEAAEPAEPSIDPSRIDAIERALENSRSNGGASNSQLVALRTELETLRSEIATLEATQRDFATELNDVRQASAEAGRNSTSVLSASLALSAIEAAANRGDTFEEEFQRLRQARPDDADVQALASLSRIEVPTLGRLKTDFRSLRTTAIARDTEESSGLGWVNSVFGDAVSVRRTSPGSDTHDRLADAEAALARDDLSIAVDAIEALPETTRSVFQTWLADARRRARLEGSLEDLRLKLIAAGQ